MSFEDWFLYHSDGLCLGIGLGMGFFVFFLLTLGLGLRLARATLAQIPGLRERESQAPTLRWFLACIAVGTALATLLTACAITAFLTVAGAWLGAL